METELTSYFNLDVYTNTGIYIGKVNDLMLNLETKSIKSIVINNINKKIFKNDINGLLVPYRWVIVVKDIILIRDIIFDRIKNKK